MLLSVDPGAGKTATIGVALFEMPSGSLKEINQMTFEEFDKFLLKVEGVTQVVYETYQIRQKFAQAHVGSKVETIRSIGLLEAFAKRQIIPIDEQPSRILPVAAKWFQIKWPMSNHAESHKYSAMLHGMYWLKQNGHIKSALQEEMEKKNA